MKKFSILICILAILFLSLQWNMASASESSDVNVLIEKYLKACASNNIDNIVDTLKKTVGFDPNDSNPKDYTKNSPEDINEIMNGAYDPAEYFQGIPKFGKYRIIGNTAVLWGTFTQKETGKGNVMQEKEIRYIGIHVKSGDKWELVCFHRDDWKK